MIYDRDTLTTWQQLQLQAQEDEQSTKEQHRENYLAAGKTVEQFEAAWPELWRITLAGRLMPRHKAL